MGLMQTYRRTDAQKQFTNISSMSFSAEMQKIYQTEATLPAASAILAGLGTSTYTDQDNGDTVICSGTVIVFGDGYGVVAYDSIQSAVSMVIYKHPVLLMRISTGLTIADGDLAYIVPEVAATEGQVTNVVGSNDLIGMFVKHDGNITVTNPQNLPAGEYAYVDFDGVQ